jgi:hypothetical protein
MYQLESKIPGVSVRLTENPLNAKIQLTESAKRELALLITINNLMENYVFTAGFYMNPRSGTLVDGVYTPREPDIEEAKEWMDSAERIYWGDDKNQDFTTERCLESDLVKYMFTALEDTHGGDCTCAPCSCDRCHAESLLGINTLPASKHVNRRLQSMWWDEYASLEQKTEACLRKEEFEKKYPPKPWTPDQATKDRWDREAIEAARLWEEHKRLLKIQNGGE